jgi:hypothetical protein
MKVARPKKSHATVPVNTLLAPTNQIMSGNYQYFDVDFTDFIDQVGKLVQSFLWMDWIKTNNSGKIFNEKYVEGKN